MKEVKPVNSNETEMRDIKEIELNLSEDEAAFSFLELTSGEASLIQDAKGNTILLNTGGEGAREHLKGQLEIFNINSIDYLFITNFSEFHTGNLEWLFGEVKIKKLLVAEQMVMTMKDNVTIPNEVKIVPVRTGSVYHPFNNLEINVLYSDMKDEEGSLALSISYGKTKIIYMGVSDKRIEEVLLMNSKIKAQILKVGFFGSEKGTSQQFLDTVDPQIAILFNKNGEMPSQDVMERLQEAWIDIFQPNKQGIILVKCTTENYEVVIVPTKAEQK
jgi:competence protein ComEC